jgi:hypothetical protein
MKKPELRKIKGNLGVIPQLELRFKNTKSAKRMKSEYDE